MGHASSTPEQLIARWKELSEDESVPFPLQLLAEEFGYTNMQLLQTRMRRIGVDLPRLSTKLYERDHAIGEIKFLLSAGVGLADIAGQLGWSADVLVRKAHDWFLEGLVDFDLRDKAWTLEGEEWKSGEFALGPGARNGRQGTEAFIKYVGLDAMAM